MAHLSFEEKSFYKEKGYVVPAWKFPGKRIDQMRGALDRLIADNPGVEIYPYPGYDVPAPHAGMPLHEHCLFKLGVPLGELWWLTDLARWLTANGRTSFFLTAPPLNLTGAALRATAR